MRFEYELQGDFDEILMCIDRAVMIDARDTKDLSADDERTVVRNYDSGVEFTLKKSGENINIAVTGEQDRLFGGNIYFDLIKDAVEDYRSGRYGGMDTVRYFAFDVCENTADSIDELYGTADNIQQHYDASDVISEIEDVRKNDIESVATQVTSEDCSEESTTENVPENIEENIIENSTENIGCNTNVSVDGEESEEEIDVATASKNDEDIHTSESKMVRTSNRTIDLVCQCDYDYENELFKSTYENISEDMWYPLDSASERDYYVILNNWWKKNSYVNKIAKKAESIVKIPGYDYISLVRGMVCLLAGIIICVVIPVGTGENSVFSYSMTVICLKIFMILQAIRGLLYIIPYTQERIKIFEWRCGKRFIFEDSSTIEGSKYSPKSLWDFERKNGVVLNSESIEFYYKTGLRSVNYKDCASIFETDNLFVIMIQNNCIASFQKCNMTSSQQACVREWFSPYYKKE